MSLQTPLDFVLVFEKPLVDIAYALIVEVWSHTNASF